MKHTEVCFWLRLSAWGCLDVPDGSAKGAASAPTAPAGGVSHQSFPSRRVPASPNPACPSSLFNHPLSSCATHSPSRFPKTLSSGRVFWIAAQPAPRGQPCAAQHLQSALPWSPSTGISHSWKNCSNRGHPSLFDGPIDRFLWVTNTGTRGWVLAGVPIW